MEFNLCVTSILKWPSEKALVEYGRLGGDLMVDHVMLEAVKAYR